MMINTEHYGSIDDHNKIDKGDTIKVECRGKVSRESGGVFPVQINDGVSSGLFGFRKFARSYIFGREKYDRQCEASASTYPENIQLGTNPKETSGSHGNAIPKGVPDAGKEERVQETEGVKVLELGNACHFPTSESGKANSEENANSSVSTETSSSGSSTSTKVDCTATLLNGAKNTVVIGNVPEGTGLQTVLSQVMGGPLRKIIPQRNDDERKTLKEVYIEFQKTEDCAEFMKYGATNLFLINGKHPDVEWYFGGETSSDVQKSCSTTSGMKGHHEECRQLMLKKRPYRKTLNKFTNAEDTLLVEFNLQELERDFSQHGEIQDITPIISRKLCIGVAYLDLESAIKTMREYSDVHSDLHKKYFDTWALWYGRDPTDQPCILL